MQHGMSVLPCVHKPLGFAVYLQSVVLILGFQRMVHAFKMLREALRVELHMQAQAHCQVVICKVFERPQHTLTCRLPPWWQWFVQAQTGMGALNGLQLILRLICCWAHGCNLEMQDEDACYPSCSAQRQSAPIIMLLHLLAVTYLNVMEKCSGAMTTTRPS